MKSKLDVANSITAAVIALDEESHLDDLLPRLAWADEIVVVDGGSRDRSVEVARRHGAHVIERPFDNFANQRNAAIDGAHSDWIFFIDADERSTERLVAEVRHRIRTEACSGYRVPIRSTIFGRRFRFSGTQNDIPLRLMRRGSGRWGGAVHERFAITGAVGKLDAHLEHFTLPTTEAFHRKMQRYTTLEAEARVARWQRPSFTDAWLRPGLELFRRLVWKQGWLDGPVGWTFCGLSGYSEWVLATKHRRLWRQMLAERHEHREPATVARLSLSAGEAA
ncbi:MAG: glycosyltransferase family 2 protein [Planctomycetia bacterium]|nr:glycosyltransferase family 2 protein [Planctomycetia bacterium]